MAENPSRPLRAVLAILMLIMSLAGIGCEDTDVGMATRAGVEAVRAVTLDDEQIEQLAQKISEHSDRQHRVAAAGNSYAERLQRLTAGLEMYQGQKFNFKVYLSPEVNAFAMADGSVRFYSGLMDMLSDTELLFVVGHEMGHVIEEHVQKKIRVALAGSAVRKAIASQQNVAGAVAGSVLGALAEKLLNVQFSQQEEREADDFGLEFMKRKGFGEKPAISALMKLASLQKEHSFWSSHPAPEARAERLRDATPASRAAEKPSLLKHIISWLQGLWPFGNDKQSNLEGSRNRSPVQQDAPSAAAFVRNVCGPLLCGPHTYGPDFRVRA